MKFNRGDLINWVDHTGHKHLAIVLNVHEDSRCDIHIFPVSQQLAVASTLEPLHQEPKKVKV